MLANHSMSHEAPKTGDFDSLTPQLIIESVEEQTDLSLIPLVQQLPSYINRVYELRDEEDDRYVVKFYRPGRWSDEAILEEHDFMEDCGEMDIPLALPEYLKQDETLGKTADGIRFSLFPYKSGRLWEFKEDDDQWYRLGQLIGRMHCAGDRCKALHRPRIHPLGTFSKDCQDLMKHIPSSLAGRFESVVGNIRQTITPLFDGVEEIRIHGDFHCGNILDRMDDGLMIIDFDDMAMGPAVQDFWLLLPGHAASCRKEFFMLLEGYQEFRPLNPSSLGLVEPLRAMRMVYFLAWCARQKEDFSFRKSFPNWGSDGFWENEIRDLQNQYQEIVDFIEKVI
ncbi:serine/threonine protein kinase [Oceanispirochaeta crateris]|uniref:Serine/threonine protein kinase n=1 Tax=Oceanispirochaeta crateris TaxID=2518645 RepID=A0A5C1QFT7_9SPIO|nr:serine/threonine protein kinase [Oceanispirochaeta crateris]QEN06925.1 serine/threonine protein kinase [Oceanispirochaeta crateris]